MLVRNFPKHIDTVDDISNIVERRRFVVIFKYMDGPHYTMFETYKDTIYDLYVINISTVLGVDYIIPKNLVVQHRNNYRGKVFSPFHPDGSYNLNAVCDFNYCYYGTRIVDGKDILKFSKRELFENSSYENYISHLMRSDIICPFPTYYNVEDQARLNKRQHNKMDFDLYFNDIPSYTLNDFRDAKTSFITIEVHDDRNMLRSFSPSNASEINMVSTQNNTLVSLVHDVFMNTLLECYDIVLKSIFSQVYIIIDLESGLFTIDEAALRIKYSYNISKEEYIKEYAGLISDVSEKIDNCTDIADYNYNNGDMFDVTIPTRLTFYISNATCEIRLSNTETDTIYQRKRPIPNYTHEYSSSDIDEKIGEIYNGEVLTMGEYYDILEEDDE
jgi:hypothetical protein